MLGFLYKKPPGNSARGCGIVSKVLFLYFNASKRAVQHRQQAKNHVEREDDKNHILRKTDEHYHQKHNQQQRPHAQAFFAFGSKGRIRNVGHHQQRQHQHGKPYKIRKYQDEAKNNWINNGYKGFFVMATGTGKTVTTLNAIYELIKEKQLLVVIAVPYKHLVRQWAEDVNLFFPDIDTYQVHSEITDAETTIYSAYKTAKLNGKSIIVITTIRSFFLERFKKYIAIFIKI